MKTQKKRDVGVYTEGIWGLGAFTLTTGLRYDHFDFRAMNGKKSHKGSVNPSVIRGFLACLHFGFHKNPGLLV